MHAVQPLADRLPGLGEADALPRRIEMVALQHAGAE